MNTSSHCCNSRAHSMMLMMVEKVKLQSQFDYIPFASTIQRTSQIMRCPIFRALNFHFYNFEHSFLASPAPYISIFRRACWMESACWRVWKEWMSLICKQRRGKNGEREKQFYSLRYQFPLFQLFPSTSNGSFCIAFCDVDKNVDTKKTLKVSKWNLKIFMNQKNFSNFWETTQHTLLCFEHWAILYPMSISLCVQYNFILHIATASAATITSDITKLCSKNANFASLLQ